MKMLMFDFRDSEKEFFKNNSFNDFDIEFIKEPLNELSNLTENQLNDTDIISVYVASHVNKNVIKKFKNLRIIAVRYFEYDNVDIDYCSKNRIAIFNVEQNGISSAAQYTFLLITALVRKLIPAYLDVQRNLINYTSYEGRDLKNLKIGFIGCNKIGAIVAKIANFYGMKIYVCDYEKNSEISSFSEYVSFEQLISHSDIITIHSNYVPEMYHIINEDVFSKMKKGAYIINTSKGEFIDLAALYNNLVSEKIGGAALDIIECENIAVADNKLDINNSSDCLTKALIIQKMIGKENVIITPRISHNTKDSVERTLQSMFNSLRDYSKGLHTNQIV